MSASSQNHSHVQVAVSSAHPAHAVSRKETPNGSRDSCFSRVRMSQPRRSIDAASRAPSGGTASPTERKTMVIGGCVCGKCDNQPRSSGGEEARLNGWRHTSRRGKTLSFIFCLTSSVAKNFFFKEINAIRWFSSTLDVVKEVEILLRRWYVVPGAAAEKSIGARTNGDVGAFCALRAAQPRFVLIFGFD